MNSCIQRLQVNVALLSTCPEVLPEHRFCLLRAHRATRSRQRRLRRPEMLPKHRFCLRLSPARRRSEVRRPVRATVRALCAAESASPRCAANSLTLTLGRSFALAGASRSRRRRWRGRPARTRWRWQAVEWPREGEGQCAQSVAERPPLAARPDTDCHTDTRGCRRHQRLDRISALA